MGIGLGMLGERGRGKEEGVDICVFFSALTSLEDDALTGAGGMGTVAGADAGVKRGDEGREEREESEDSDVGFEPSRLDNWLVSRDRLTAPCLRCSNCRVAFLVLPSPSEDWWGFVETVSGGRVQHRALKRSSASSTIISSRSGGIDLRFRIYRDLVPAIRREILPRVKPSRK